MTGEPPQAAVDKAGYRYNVGIVLINKEARLFWGRRVGQKGWQFPQGGMHVDETLEQALFRELYEEVGLEPTDVQILAATQEWLSYLLPERYVRHHQKPVVFGQKQRWFLLQLESDDSKIDLESGDEPEFDRWKWVDLDYPLQEIVEFKKNVYEQVLQEFTPYINDVKLC